MVVSSSSVAGGVMESGMERPHCWRLITKGCHLDLVLQGADEAFPQKALHEKWACCLDFFQVLGEVKMISSLTFTRHAFDWTSCVFQRFWTFFKTGRFEVQAVWSQLP